MLKILDFLKPGHVFLPILIAIAVSLSLTSISEATDLRTQATTVIKAEKNENNGEIIKKASKAQMPFIANEGQIENESVMFYAQTFGGTVYVTRSGEIVYSLPKFKEKTHVQGANRLLRHDARDTLSHPVIAGGWSLKEQLVGGSNTSPRGVDAVQTKVNYFLGNDKSKWYSNITTYNMVSLGEVYPGIDLGLKAHGNNVEKIFTVNPGADVNQIRLKMEGAASLKVNKKGELEIETGLGPVRFTKPIAFQERDGKKEYVQVAYYLDKDHYGFTVKDYDSSRPLMIDPLLASTFIGGSSNNCVNTMALDSAGNVYVAGYTWSSDYPTTAGAYDTSHNGRSDAFVSKLDASLSTLIASTFIGGSFNDYSNSMAVDSSGNIYIAGETWSDDYPTISGAYDTSHNGCSDAFVSMLDASLSTLIASTYIGGSYDDEAHSLAIDSVGNIYVAGKTTSSDHPTTAGAYDTSYNYNGGYRYRDVFVTKLEAGLSTLIASTYIGGTNDDYGYSMAIDSLNNIYVAGFTCSNDYPITSGAYDTTYNGYDAFVTKLDASLSTLIASTFIGGIDDDYAYSMAIDRSGDIYVAGETWSDDYPTTAGAYDTSFGGLYNAFISKLNHSLDTLIDSTYIGGSNGDLILSLAIDSMSNIYAAGWTNSTDYPTTAGAYNTIHNGNEHAFISKLDTHLRTLLASTYIGGSYIDNAYSLAIDGAGNVYVAGKTYSNDYPTTTGAYDTSYNGGFHDAFISKLTGDLSADNDKSHLGKRSYCFYGKESVNLSTGNFILEHTDLTVPSIGLPMELTRFYNSKDNYESPLGKGWTHNYNTHLTINNDLSVSVTYADGQVLIFSYNGSSYDRPAGCFETLAVGPDSTYVLTYKDQTKYTYNTDGKLISITDKNGNTLTLTYTNDILTAATEPAGRSLTFDYDDEHRLTSVTDPAGRTVSYTYDNNGNLSTVQDVRSGLTQYNYDNLGLTEIIAPDGNTLLGNTYDSDSRVTQQIDGNGIATIFNYDQSNRTTMTDALGDTITADYDGKYRNTGVTYPGNLTETFTYDENNCRTGITDALNRTTTTATTISAISLLLTTRLGTPPQ